MFIPWALELRVLIERTERPIRRTLGWSWYAHVITQKGWSLLLNRDGTVSLIVDDDTLAQHDFLTLREACLTGSLLYPEDFLPLGH
jgi:hypothetical protein